MYRLGCAILFASLLVWGCTSTSRDRLHRFLFDVPDQAQAGAPTTAMPVGTHAAPTPVLAAPRFASIHPPYKNRECRRCHDAAQRMLPREDVKTFCRACHATYLVDEDAEEDPAVPIEHYPVADGQCFECHDPHHSDQPNLLKMPLFELCLQCHDEPEDLSEEAHAAAGVERCTDCHDPHFGELPMLRGAAAGEKTD